MISLIQNLGWTDLKTRRKNSRLLCMFEILNELAKIPKFNDHLIPVDKKDVMGRHNQTYKHIRAITPSISLHWDKIIFGIELFLIGIIFRPQP